LKPDHQTTRRLAMRYVWLIGLVLTAAPGAAQSFEGTNLDPYATPYPAPPYLYEGSCFLSVTFTTSTGVVQALVPEPLADIPINGILNVETCYLDIELPFGGVVWDYLAQPGGCALVLS